ncbi:hypothetical protein ES708_21585 [subsurface metagenome]
MPVFIMSSLERVRINSCSLESLNSIIMVSFRMGFEVVGTSIYGTGWFVKEKL